MPTPSPHDASRRLPMWKKGVYGGIAMMLFFVAVELTLRLILPAPLPEDHFVGFSPSVPLLLEERNAVLPVADHNVPGNSQTRDSRSEAPPATVVRVNPAKRVWFNDQSFEKRKPAGTIRVVCLGGSTTYGRPYEDATSFCGWLRATLALIDADHRWEVINAGGISYASYRVANVMQEFAPYEVDLFVLYTGQNEFLERRTYGDLAQGFELPRRLATWAGGTRTGASVQRWVRHFRRPPPSTLSGEVDEILNHSIGPSSYRRDPEWARGVREHFAANLDRMEQISELAGAKLLVVTPVSNLRDCSPFKSAFSGGLDASALAELTQRLASARRLRLEGDVAEATQQLSQILERDQVNADAHFEYAKCLFDKHEYADARRHFSLAIDHDLCPLRATAEIGQIVRDFMNRDTVIAVDMDSRLSETSRGQLGHACFGQEYFLDHVHPTVQTHGMIARAIIEALQDEGMLPPEFLDPAFELAAAEIQSLLDRPTQTRAFRNLAKVNHWAGKFEDAQRQALNALRLTPGDLESRFIVADCLDKEGLADAAMEQYARLFEEGEFAPAYQPYGELLASQGHLEAAKAYLMQAVFANEPTRQESAYRSLGNLHKELGESELAEECFQRADELNAKHRRAL